MTHSKSALVVYFSNLFKWDMKMESKVHFSASRSLTFYANAKGWNRRLNQLTHRENDRPFHYYLHRRREEGWSN